MRLEPVIMPDFLAPAGHHEGDGEAPPQITGRYKNIREFLGYYMGKNTPERQADIVANLRIEKELEFKEEAALPEAA
jgi:hypothetical protein